MNLSYSFIDPKESIGVPPRKINGGLYTGEAATGDWGNIPVVPEAHLYTENLKSANPPPMAIHHIPGYTRLGNNTQQFPGHSKNYDTLLVQCINRSS
jgi:hypothetical protein